MQICHFKVYTYTRVGRTCCAYRFHFPLPISALCVRYNVIDMIPSLSGANGVAGVVLRGVTSTGSVASAAIAVELPRCGSADNTTGGTGVIVSGVSVLGTPVAIAFTTSFMKSGLVCPQPPPYIQGVLHNASFTAVTGDADMFVEPNSVLTKPRSRSPACSYFLQLMYSKRAMG